MSTPTPDKPAGAGERDASDTDPNGRAFDELTTGTMVGEYRIDQRIGAGGMGIVYSAVHPVIDKRVAIKVLKAEVCDDEIAVTRFIDEARLVNRIEHPNIVDIFAFGQLPNGRQYFVMEWLRGESLGARLDRGTIPMTEICDLLLPLSRALAAAHEQGVVHRDLKPDNVFLVTVRDEPPLVKLLDFGVAKLTQQAGPRLKEMGQTATGAIVGTPQYLSPEQAKGDAVDYRADVYALAGIAFEALTSRPPFVANTVMEVVAMHIMEPPVAPSTFRANVPYELDQLVLATLAKNPALRPPLSAWIDVLERWKQQHLFDSQPRLRAMTPDPTPPPRPIATTRAHPAAPRFAPPSMPTPAAPRARRRAVVIAAAAVTMSVAIGLVASVVWPREPGVHETHVVAPVIPEQTVNMPASSGAPPAAAPTPTALRPAENRGSATQPTPPPRHHHGRSSAVPTSTSSTDDANDLLAPGSLRAGSAGSGSAVQP